MVQALKKELILEKPYLQEQKISSIYFGGGTPSLLSSGDIASILETINLNYNIESGAEITLESNPDDINRNSLSEWKSSGINRLSIGVQTFFEEELRWMNRAHNAIHARECIEMSLAAGFNNFTIDLIYGSPLLTDEMWKFNVDTATSYGIPHLSCYALTVEEKTPLHKKVLELSVKDVENEKQARQFFLLMQWLKEKGYEHYEVSNFAKPGMRSRHNSSYWKGTTYLGIGPSAHSYNGNERRWNIANNNVYIRTIKEGRPERETEFLSRKERINETIMISLRTMEGLNLDNFEKLFGATERIRVEKGLGKYISQDLMRMNQSNAFLTDKGMLVADGIAANLFSD